MAAIAGAVMLSIPSFQWVAFGAMRMAIVCVFALIVRAIWWPEIDKFIQGSEYDDHFSNRVQPWVRVAIVVAVNISLMFASVLCFCL